MPATAFAAPSSGPSPGGSNDGVSSSSCSRARRGDDRQRALGRPFGQHAGDQQPVDLVGAFEDAVDPGVAVLALGGIVVHEAVAAVDLHVLVDDDVNHLAARDLEDGRLDGELFERGEHGVALVRAVDGAVDQPGGAIEHRLDGVLADDHFGELLADGAERGDGLAELLPLGGIRRRLRDYPARAAAAHRRQLEAAVVQDVERDFVALADFPEHVLRRHARVLQDQRGRGRPVQAHLVLFLAGTDAGERALDQKSGELSGREVCAGLNDLGEHHEQIGEAAVRDPHLLAGQQEAAVWLRHGASLGTERVRARARLRQCIRADHFAGDERRQVLRLLRLRSEAEQRGDRQARLGAERRRKRRAAADGLSDDQRRRLVQRDAAERLGHIGPEQPELAASPDQVARQRPVLCLQLVEDRQHFVVDEVLGRPADQPVLLAQPLGREHRCRIDFLGQPGSAADCRCRRHQFLVLLCSARGSEDRRAPHPVTSKPRNLWRPGLQTRLTDATTCARRFRLRPCRRRRTLKPGRIARSVGASRRGSSPSAWRRCSRADGRAQSRRRSR